MYMQWIHPNQTKCPNIQISNQTRDFKDPPKKKNMKTHLGTWQSSLRFKTSDLWIWLWSKTPTPKDVTCFLPSKMPFQSPSPISFVGFCQYHTWACKHHSSPGDLLKCVWFFWGDLMLWLPAPCPSQRSLHSTQKKVVDSEWVQNQWRWNTCWMTCEGLNDAAWRISRRQSLRKYVPENLQYMSPKKCWLEDYFPFEMVHLLVTC